MAITYASVTIHWSENSKVNKLAGKTIPMDLFITIVQREAFLFDAEGGYDKTKVTFTVEFDNAEPCVYHGRVDIDEDHKNWTPMNQMRWFANYGLDNYTLDKKTTLEYQLLLAVCDSLENYFALEALNA